MPSEELSHVSDPSLEFLNPRQAVDYDSYVVKLVDWLKTTGKDPDRDEGLAELTAENYASRIDKFYRWVWENYGGYMTRVTHEHADEYADSLARDKITKRDGEAYSESSKRKTIDALTKLFHWRSTELDGEEWECEVNFNENTYNHADELSVEERNKLRGAVLEYQSIPHYNNLLPEERDRWRAYLAQQLGKPKHEVSPDDWDEVNQSWKIPSLVWTTLDAGLRPVEVARAKVSWLRLEKSTLAIPREESSKNDENWEVAITERTSRALKRWLEQRENDPDYDNRDEIWLNRQGNPYSSANLNYLLQKLCEEADIDVENRKITWYSIRHSVGTYMTSRGNLAEAREQLRHKNLETTLRYAHPPLEDRRDTLGKIG